MFQDVKVDFRSLQTQFLDDMVKLGTLCFFFFKQIRYTVCTRHNIFSALCGFNSATLYLQVKISKIFPKLPLVITKL
jgi:hypothetical protein